MLQNPRELMEWAWAEAAELQGIIDQQRAPLSGRLRAADADCDCAVGDLLSEHSLDDKRKQEALQRLSGLYCEVQAVFTIFEVCVPESLWTDRTDGAARQTLMQRTGSRDGLDNLLRSQNEILLMLQHLEVVMWFVEERLLPQDFAVYPSGQLADRCQRCRAIQSEEARQSRARVRVSNMRGCVTCGAVVAAIGA
jgi:hypothetical protein